VSEVVDETIVHGTQQPPDENLSAPLLLEEDEQQNYELFIASIPALAAAEVVPTAAVLAEVSGWNDPEALSAEGGSTGKDGWNFSFPLGPLVWEEGLEAASHSLSHGDTVWYQPVETMPPDEWHVLEQKSDYPQTEASDFEVIKSENSLGTEQATPGDHLETTGPDASFAVIEADYVLEEQLVPETLETTDVTSEDGQVPDANFLMVEPDAQVEEESELVIFEETASQVQDLSVPYEAELQPSDREATSQQADSEADELEMQRLDAALEELAKSEAGPNPNSEMPLESPTAGQDVVESEPPASMAPYNPFVVAAKIGNQLTVARQGYAGAVPEPRKQAKPTYVPIGDGFGLHGLSPVSAEQVPLSSRGHSLLPEGLPQHSTIPAEVLHRSLSPTAPINAGSTPRTWRIAMTILAVVISMFFLFAGWWNDGVLLKSMRDLEWLRLLSSPNREKSAASNIPALVQEVG